MALRCSAWTEIPRSGRAGFRSDDSIECLSRRGMPSPVRLGKTLEEGAKRAFDEQIERLLSQHGVDYVRGYVDALKDASTKP
jgi:hypothetical protein